MEHVNNGLYIGGIKDVSPVSDTEVDLTEFERVITLGDASTPYTTEQYLIGRQSWNEDPFFAAVDSVREILSDPDLRGFAHCQVGINRVAAVTATGIAAEDGVGLEDGIRILEEVMDVDLHDSHHEIAEAYLRRDA